MQIFGEVDKTKEGKVKSEYPSWYHQAHVEELQEGIRHKEYQLKNDLIAGSERGVQATRLKQEKEKLDKIESSKPKLSGAETDKMVKVIKSLTDKISGAMFKRSEMEKGIADAHEEARRIADPCVKLDDDEITFCKACDVTISHDGKVTRTGAEKAWKIGRRLLGENSNVETLRRG